MTNGQIPLVVAAVIALLGIVSCSATDTVAEDGLVYNEPAMDPNQLVCKRQRPVGSHIPRRVCRTRAQIEQDREAALRSTGPLRTMGGIGPPPPAASPSPP